MPISIENLLNSGRLLVFAIFIIQLTSLIVMFSILRILREEIESINNILFRIKSKLDHTHVNLERVEMLLVPPRIHPAHKKGVVAPDNSSGFCKPGEQDPSNNGLYKAYVPGKDPNRIAAGLEKG